MVAGSDAELALELAGLDAQLRNFCAGRADSSPPALAVAALLAEHASPRLPRAPLKMPPIALPGLARIADRHELSRFDCAALLLAAAAHIDRRYARLFCELDGDTRPSLGFAMEVLADPFALPRHEVLARFDNSAPLVEHGLVQLTGNDVFSSRRIDVPDIVWQRMLGMTTADPFALAPQIADNWLVTWADIRRAIVDASAWLGRDCPVIVRGPSGSGREGLASAIATRLGRRLLVIGPASVPATDIVREAAWHQAIPLLSAQTDLDVISTQTPAAIVIAEPQDGLPSWLTSCAYQLTVERPDSAARIELWQRHVGTRTSIDLGAVVDQFRFGPANIAAAGTLAMLGAAARNATPTTRDALAAARQISCAHLDRLADRLPSELTLDDLVLAPKTRRELELAIAWGRQLARLRNGNVSPHLRSVGGLACLFSGPSGTGKTTAATVLGRALELPVFRIDLSQIVNKYIGETEKNLARVFDDAEAANVVLFFDEADALFARRTEVRDAHDRFANIETGYLLQRLERHPGIAILATNLQANIDDAFARRLQVIVEFGLPDTRERGELWRRMLPAPDLRAHVDIDFLAARFPLSGGDIRNAVVASMVLADTNAVAMEHVMIAVFRELQRSGRLTHGADFAQWQSQLAAWVGGRPRAGA